MDHVGLDLMHAAETRLGVPRTIEVEQELLAWELDLIERICGTTRYHDVTIFTFAHQPGEAFSSEPQLALIHKPSDPPGALWAPTGGVEPGESLEQAVIREACEELGIRVRPTRYVLRMETVFHCGFRTRPWRSHVFVSEPEGTAATMPLLPWLPTLDPVDREEVAYAAWVPLSCFRQEVVPVLRNAGWGRFQYRLTITEHLFRELGL